MLTATARVIQTVLDAILPPKERVARIERYTIEDFSLSPTEHVACSVQITTLMPYRSHAVEDVIRALKYDHSGKAAQLLADVLAEYLCEEIANIQLFSTKPVVLVPVPLHPSRERERGFNQVTKILNALPHEFRDGILSRIATDALTRTRATPQQTRLSRGERLKNVEGAFALATDGSAVRGTHVILIDDVTTTGATLAAAARPLKGETVTLLALAHA